MSLAYKCIVVGCFICGDYGKILMETRSSSDSFSVTENGLVLTEGFRRQILPLRTSAIDLIQSESVNFDAFLLRPSSGILFIRIHDYAVVLVP